MFIYYTDFTFVYILNYNSSFCFSPLKYYNGCTALPYLTLYAVYLYLIPIDMFWEMYNQLEVLKQNLGR